MIENPIKTRGELVNIAVRENVGFRDRHVPAVIGDVLIASKGIRLCESR